MGTDTLTDTFCMLQRKLHSVADHILNDKIRHKTPLWKSGWKWKWVMAACVACLAAICVLFK